MKLILLFILTLFAYCTFAQNNYPNAVLARRDTVRMQADKMIAEAILQAIEQGKLKAVDCFTNESIPAGQVYSWRMSADTILRYDTGVDTAKMEIAQRYRSATAITHVKIQQDWYMDTASGKFNCRINWIELLEEISSFSGAFIGYRPFCRIYY
jgi:hypothetical protein